MTLRDNIQSITTVLPVEAIEPSIPFWEALGYVQDQAVPEAATTDFKDSDKLGFIIMQGKDAQIMYQNYNSLKADSESFTAAVTNSNRPTLLFIKVDDLDAIVTALDGHEVVMERRQTFYGSDEIGYREPGGHIVTFAAFND